MAHTPFRTRRRLLAAVVSVLVTVGVVATAATASARTELPVFGWDTVFTGTFNTPFDIAEVGTGQASNSAGPSGNPKGWLGVGSTGWAALRKTIRVPTGPGGHAYESCQVSAVVDKIWGSGTRSLINVEAINPSTWNYMNQTRVTLTTDAVTTINGASFTPNPREFVIGIAIVADPASPPQQSLITGFVLDDVTVSCFYFYYV